MSRTIRENLLIVRPDATDQQVEQATRMADAHDFIHRQPHGYDNVVGERGDALSGGQRQWIGIACALLCDPRILVLDGLTMEKVVRAMKDASVGRTTFVIAHRLATIQDADRILFFRDGAVTESGTFDELMLHDGGFAALARSLFQKGPATPARETMPTGTPHLRLVYSRQDAHAFDHGRLRAYPYVEVGHSD